MISKTALFTTPFRLALNFPFHGAMFRHRNCIFTSYDLIISWFLSLWSEWKNLFLRFKHPLGRILFSPNIREEWQWLAEGTQSLTWMDCTHVGYITPSFYNHEMHKHDMISTLTPKIHKGQRLFSWQFSTSKLEHSFLLTSPRVLTYMSLMH
jgi:hypothetical protein